jgi:hypothetical protein
MARRCRIGCLVAWVALGATARDAAATDGAAFRLYEVTTQTGMPHLEENLRHATVTATRCIDRRDLSRQFWMLDDVSLQDCRLVKEVESEEASTYALQCEGGHGATGDARWELASDKLVGTLHVRLGGKNMTFYQRIVATPIGACR